MSDRVPYIPPSMRSVIEEKTPEIPEWLKDNYPDWLDDYMLIYDVDHPISREQFEEFEKVHEDQIDRQLILPEIREFKHADSSRKNIEIVKKSLCAVENFAMDEINKFHRLKFKDKDEKEMIFKTMLRFRHNVSWTHFEWEHLKKLNDYINSKIDSPFIVDLYAGHGYIAKVFEYLGYLVKAYDDYSWTVNPIFTKVTKKSAVDAVEETFDTVQKEKNIIFMFIMPPGDDDDSAQKALMQILKNGKTHMGNIYFVCIRFSRV